jgi:hypothetical protein
LRSDAEGLAVSADRSRRTLIEEVRSSVADAERRMNLRVATEAPCELVFDGKHHAGRLANISEGGARIAIAGQFAAGTRGELQVAAFRLAAPCKVVEGDADAGQVSVAFDVPIELPTALRGAVSLAA